MPYAKTGGLADVIEALPHALVKLGHEVAVFLPRYRGVKASSVVLPSMTIPQGTRLRFPAIANGGIHRGVRYFFLDDPFYFDRDGIYGDKNHEYPDNAERFTEFSRAAIELAKQVWMPDLIHCHDWQTAMVPVLLRTSYGDDPAVRDLPVVFTIHNMGYHGIFPKEALGARGNSGWRLSSRRNRVFWQREFPEGRPDLFRLSDHGQPEICAGNSNFGIWLRTGRRDAYRGPTGWWES